jgi:peptidoglycan endopeptidase LytE
MNNLQKDQIVSLCKSLLGAEYKRGATLEEAPKVFDCSSFTQYVFKLVGFEIPRSTILQAEDLAGAEISVTSDFSNLEVGDLLFMRSDWGYYHDQSFGGRRIEIGHVAIYVGNGEIFHCRKSLGGVVVQKLEELIKEPNYAITFTKRY